MTLLIGEPSGNTTQDLSLISLIRFTGYIRHVDPEDLFLYVAVSQEAATAEDDYVKIGLDEWDFAFADPNENPNMREGLIGVQGKLCEAVSLTRQNYLQVGLFAV